MEENTFLNHMCEFAWFLWSYAQSTIIDRKSLFKNAYARDTGGVAIISESTAIFNESKFINNSANNVANIEIITHSNITFDGTIFESGLS